MSEQHKLIHPLKHFRDFIDNNVRFDGRTFDKSRPIALNVGSFKYAHGSSAVKLGNTNIVCGIRAELAKPRPTIPNIGYFIPTVDMTLIVDNKNTELPDTIISTIYKTLTLQSCLKLEDLCIESEKLVWVFYLEIICIEIDGSVLDAALLASVSALRNLRLPKVTYDVILDKVNVDENEKISISIGPTPTICSHTIFNNVLLTDPTKDEEELSDAVLNVGVSDEQVGVMFKNGGVPMKKEDIDKALDIAEKREQKIKVLCAKVSEVSLKTDEKQTKKQVEKD